MRKKRPPVYNVPTEPKEHHIAVAALPRPLRCEYDCIRRYRYHYDRWLRCRKIVLAWARYTELCERAPESVSYGSLQDMTTEQFQRTVERITRGELVLAITR